MNRTWYTDFFSGVVVDLWRRVASPDGTRAEAGFLQRELRLKPGDRVLDVPCGFGRHALELARRGCRVTGVDISAEMIGVAKEQAGEAGLEVEWLSAEMRELQGEALYDAAFCFGNSFGYLDREGTRAFLRAISRVLKPGGGFAFEYGLAAESILRRLAGREWFPVGDLYFLEANRYDLAESCLETTYTFIRPGSVETKTGLQWVFTVGELHAMLSEAGFGVQRMASSCDGHPYELGSPVLFMVARKQ